MKSLQIKAPGEVELLDLPIPEPGADEVRVKVVMCNTCPQWDLHLSAGEPMFVGSTLNYPYTPGQPGHEMTGIVDAVGAGVTDFSVGQRVAAWKDAGHNRPGCYAEYVVHDQDNLLVVPDDVAPERVCSLELAMCVSACAMILHDMNAVEGKLAAVNGLGPAGLIAAQLLKAEGAAKVVGLEPNEGRRQYALDRGVVDEAHDSFDPAVAEALPLRSRGGAFDLAIDCVGFPQAVRFLMDRVKKHFATFAVQRHDYVFAPSHQGLILIGYQGHSKSAARYALDQILAGRLDLELLISEKLPLERYLEGVELLKQQQAIKICYVP